MKRHYIDVHKVDENNKFFINLFKQSDNVFCGRKCLRYDEFLPTTLSKKAHDFLIHYGSGKNVFEEKPLNYTTIGKILASIWMIMIFITQRAWLIIFY